MARVRTAIFIALGRVKIRRAAPTIGNASTPVSSKCAAFQGEVTPDTTAVLSLLEALGMVHAATAILTIWKESLETIRLDVHEGLENGVFCNDFIVVHCFVQLVKVDVAAFIENSLRSNTTRVTEVDGSWVQPLLEVMIPVVKVGDNYVIVLIWTQRQGVVIVIRIPRKDDSLLIPTDDVELSGGIWSCGEGLHSILEVVNVLQDFSLDPTTCSALFLEKQIQQVLDIRLLWWIAGVDLNGVAVGTTSPPRQR